MPAVTVDRAAAPTEVGAVALVASDLDGTLLAPGGTLSDRTRRVLDQMRDRGIDLVAVTGRPPRWVRELGLGSGLCICSNGALVVDLDTGAVVTAHTLEPTVAAEIVTRLRTLHPTGLMAVEYGDGIGVEQAWREQVPRSDAETVGPAEELVVRPAAKILLRVPGTSGDAYIDAATDAVGDLGVVTASGTLQLVEVSAPGVDKASTLATLCAERGIPASRVVAFGDARNDLPLLAWAGTGVAMADAHPTVVAVADDVTGTCDTDGVAAWLEAHVL